ncbi:predicted protein [Botrytis cinerea T4]|uniref:Uncharacterized protein n=1 Tax=Botryotinia fuckeliana (strain T4) TaxID=999810 RepID=G2YJB4_BOTF4|nr:predicted protein [Botrytis cinerea T4]
MAYQDCWKAEPPRPQDDIDHEANLPQYGLSYVRKSTTAKKRAESPQLGSKNCHHSSGFMRLNFDPSIQTTT